MIMKLLHYPLTGRVSLTDTETDWISNPMAVDLSLEIWVYFSEFIWNTSSLVICLLPQTKSHGINSNSCGEIRYYWRDIQKNWLGGLTTYTYITVDVEISAKTTNKQN